MAVRVMSSKILIGALLLAAAGSGRAQRGEPAAQPEMLQPADPSEPETMGIDDLQTRMTLPISIDGNGPYAFLIDSGAERTIISNELAGKLALSPGHSVRLHSMSGASDVATVLIPGLRLNKKRPERVEAPSLKQVNIGAAGMLGLDMLKSQRIIFDFGRKMMTMSPSGYNAISSDPAAIMVKGRSRFGRLVLVDASMDGQKIVVIVDTGSQITIGNEALRQRLIAKNKFPQPSSAQLISVTGGVINADYTAVKSLRIGGVLMKDVSMAFADAHPFEQLDLRDRPAILLGMDVLRLFNKVAIDFPNREVRFLINDLSFLNDVQTADAGGPGRG